MYIKVYISKYIYQSIYLAKRSLDSSNNIYLQSKDISKQI